VIAVVAAFAILFGVQLLMFGVLSDMLVTVNREQTRRLEDLAARMADDDRTDRFGGGPADSLPDDALDRAATRMNPPEADGDDTGAAGAVEAAEDT